MWYWPFCYVYIYLDSGVSSFFGNDGSLSSRGMSSRFMCHVCTCTCMCDCVLLPCICEVWLQMDQGRV